MDIQMRRVKEAKVQNTKVKKHEKRTFTERINPVILFFYASTTLKPLRIESCTNLSNRAKYLSQIRYQAEIGASPSP